MAQNQDKNPLTNTPISKTIKKIAEPARAALATVVEITKECLPSPEEIAKNITKVQERAKRREIERAQNRDRSRSRSSNIDLDI